MQADQFYSGARPRSSESCFLKFVRILLMTMNALITIAALAAVVFALMERKRVELTLREICTQCNDLFLAYIIVFALLFTFSFLGFFALCTRNTCLRSLYVIYLFVVLLVALSVSTLYLLVTRGTVSLDGFWEGAVKKDNVVCKFELELQCSGWKAPCHTSPPLLLSNGSASNDGASCPVCSPEDQDKINSYNITCEKYVIESLKEHAQKALPIGFSVAGIALIAMIVTCMVNREFEEKRHGGYYYRI